MVLTSSLALLLAFPANAEVLPLSRALEQALARNTRIQMARQATLAARAAVAVAEGRFAVGLGSDFAIAQRNANSQNQGGQFRYRVGLDKLFSSGTRVGLVLAGSQVWSRPQATQDVIDQLATPWQTDPFYFGDLGYGGLAITIEQALLRGGGFGVNEAPIQAAQSRLEAHKVALARQISAQLRDVEAEYWSWAAAVRAVEIRRTSLDLAILQQKRTEELIRKGRQAKVDALLAENIVADRQDALAVAEAEAATRYENLHILMGSRHAEIPSPPERPQGFPKATAKVEPVADLLELAEDQSFALRQLRLELDGAQFELERLENAAWPELNARARVELYGTDATFAEAYGDAFASGNHVWTGMINFSYPLGTNPAAAEAERLHALVNRQRDAVRDLGRMTELAVATARRDSELAQNRISLATLAKHLAEEKLQAEEARYSLGRTTMQNLRLFQEDLDEASLRELQARVSLLAAQAQLDHLLGRLLDKRGIRAR